MPYTPHQKQMISLALKMSQGDIPKVRRALLEAMAVESNFRNLNYGDRDSQGVLQQRPGQGWGPAGNPQQDIQQFLSRARRNSQGFAGSAGSLAQSVQRSAFPARYDARLRQANELLRSLGGSLPASQPGSAGTSTAGSTSPQGTLQGLRSLQQSFSQGPLQMVQAIQALQKQRQGPLMTPLGGRQKPVQPPVAQMRGNTPEELFYDPLGSYDSGHFGGPIGGHSDHVHVSETNPAAMLHAIQLAKSLGLRVSENPWVDHVDPVHTGGSFHYRGEPFRGRRMGQALDVSGPAAKMAAFYRSLAPRKKR